jgi:hypothetical protein
MVVLYVGMILAGLVMLVLPGQVWRLTEQWKSQDAAEPSALYLASTRCGGTVVTIVGVAGLLLAR